MEEALRANLQPLILMTWMCVVAAFCVARRQLKSRGIFHAINAANGLLVLSPIALILLLLSGGSPVAQMSKGGLWDLWFNAWPLLILTTLGALVLLACGAIYHVLVNVIVRKRKEFAVFVLYLLPSAINVLMTAMLLREAAPDA